MHWIEQLLHVSPDGGSGTAEFAIFLGLVALAAVPAETLRRRLQRVRRRRA